MTTWLSPERPYFFWRLVFFRLFLFVLFVFLEVGFIIRLMYSLMLLVDEVFDPPNPEGAVKAFSIIFLVSLRGIRAMIFSSVFRS